MPTRDRPTAYRCEARQPRRQRDTMDYGYAAPMESPFVIPHEDVEALGTSKAFCALRRHLARDAEYVVFPCRVKQAYLSRCRIALHLHIPAPASRQHQFEEPALTDMAASAQHTRNARPRRNRHISSTATCSTPSSCPS